MPSSWKVVGIVPFLRATGTFGMGDRGPKACGPCVALTSRECQTHPDRKSVYTFVPAEYRLVHSLEATAAVCRSNFCHAKVRLRGEPQPAGRPVGWTKRGRDATEVVIDTAAKAEHGRQRPSRCANGLTPMPASCMPARHLPRDYDPLVSGLIESIASVIRARREQLECQQEQH